MPNLPSDIKSEQTESEEWETPSSPEQSQDKGKKTGEGKKKNQDVKAETFPDLGALGGAVKKGRPGKKKSPKPKTEGSPKKPSTTAPSTATVQRLNWKPEEDDLILSLVNEQGPGTKDWAKIAEEFNKVLGRTSHQICMRWHQKLKKLK